MEETSFILDLNTAISAVLAQDKHNPSSKKFYVALCVMFFGYTLRNDTLPISIAYTTIFYTIIWNIRMLAMLYKIRQIGRMQFLTQQINQDQTAALHSLLHLTLSLTDRDFTDEGIV